MRQRRVTRVEHPVHICVDYSMPLLDGHLSDWAEKPDAGIVHKDIQTSVTRYGGLDSLLHCLGAPHIRPNREDSRRATHILQRRGASLECRIRGRGDRHLRATLDERAGHGQTDAAGASGHQGDFACKRLHALLQYTR